MAGSPVKAARTLDASDIGGVSAIIAGATLGRVTDNGDGTGAHVNGQFEPLIDDETTTAAFNLAIQGPNSRIVWSPCRLRMCF